ncbi:MAG: FkbM family methyltransferase, partial [Anaerolineae bacterium]|nr:FkbM family methyltransferase [Anaerolineae bacterium]
REPDEAGWQSWTRYVQSQQVAIEAVRDAFLACEEFQQLEAERNRPHLTEVDGFKLFYLPRDWAVGNEIARAGVYELHVVASLKPLLQPGLVFLDIGANIGYYTLLAASRVGPTGRVIAFEPHPRNVELLTMSVRENGFEHVQIYPLAVSNAEGAVELIGDPTSTNASFAVPGVSDPADVAKAYHVKTVVLDQCLQAEPRIDIVKMDIEGVEPLAWQGMRQLIQRHRPIVLTEFSPEAIRHQDFATPEAYLAMIRTMGYQLRILDSSTYTMTPALSDAEIMSRQAELGIHHLDLVAFPQ